MTLFDQPTSRSYLTPEAAWQQAMHLLWPYQRTAYTKIWNQFYGDVPSTLLVLPTGTGKTVVFSQVAQLAIALGMRVLVLAHREELITQAADTLASFGVHGAIEKADERARAFGNPACVVASVQTMQGKRLASWSPGHFGLIITDEAHHAVSDSYRRVYDHLRPRCHLGVTATADRLDKTNLSEVYQTLAFEYSLRDAIAEGYLARLRFVECETSVDLANIRTTAGDLNQADLEELIRPHIDELANVTAKEIANRRSIVFTPDVGSAQAYASALDSLGIRAASIAGDSKDRAEIIKQFRSGHYRVLCNCNLLTEGFDAKFIQAVVLARPTKSRSLYSQMVGRGTRKFPNKENCLIVDFAWLTGRHKLINPVSLFRKSTDEVTDDDRADEADVAALLKQGELDLMDAIEQAREERAERRRLEVKAKKREVQYGRVSYDPFGSLDAMGLPTQPESERALRSKPTEKQLAVLKRAKIKNAEQMSKARASQYIDFIFDRKEKKLSTLPQSTFLIEKGYKPDEVNRMPFESAKLHIDRILGRVRT